MGRASISIAITSNFNSSGIDAAIRKAEQLAVSAVHHQGQFGKSMVDMGTSMGQASARLASMGKSIADVGDRLTTRVTIPMGLAATASVMAAAKIDTAWYNVRKTVDMTEEGYQRLKQGAMALAETQPVSAETILNIEALGGQLGIANDYLEDFAKIVSGLDIATNLDSETAATELAQFRNIVQMSEDDLDNMASTIVDLGNHTATTEADIMQLALRFASAGHVAGMSNQDILGLSAALAGLGMKADAGGSALSQVINKISLDVAKGGENVQKWAGLVGEAPEQFAEAWRKAPTDEFVKVLKAISQDGADANEILNDLGITQIRQSDAMRRLASSGDLVTESIQRANQAWRENTALTREVDNRNESLQARWDTLVNRFTNDLARIGQPIAEIGLDALDGLEPVIQGVGDLTQAFADADPGVQKYVVNLGAVAMAAGPVLSITGRLMQGMGKAGQTVGRMSQQWGVYREALKTTDVSMLTTLSNNQSFAAQFGASRNAIVKAAGGIETFNVAYRKTIGEIQDRNKAQVQAEFRESAYNEALKKTNMTEEKALAIAERASRSSKARAEWTSRIKDETDRLNDSITEDNVNLKLHTENVTDAERKSEKAALSFGKMGDAIKGAFLGIAGMAASGLLVAGITAFATECERAAQHAATLDRATRGLREATSNTAVQLNSFEGATQRTALSAGALSQEIEAAMESQAKLGESIRETNVQASAQIGSLSRAWGVIEQYANHSGLNASEQYRLKSAIQEVNEACGTQFAVVDAANGKIADETGTILENTNAIRDNIEQRKRQIELEAMEANLSGLYEQRIRNEQAISDAWATHGDKLREALPALERVREIQQELAGITDHNSQRYQSLSQELGSLVGQLDPTVQEFLELRGMQDENSAAIQRMEAEYGILAGSLDRANGSLQQWVSQSDRMRAWFGDATGGIEGFAAACEAAGLNTIQLSQMSDAALSAIRDSYDGTKESVIQALKGMGSEGEAILAQLPENWRGSMSEATQGVIDEITNMGQYSLTQLRDLSMQFGIEGEGMTRAFMDAIRNGIRPEEAAELARRLDEQFGNALSPDKAAKAAQAYMDALSQNLSREDAIQAAIDAIKAALGMVDFSDEGRNAGHTFFASFNESLQQNALDSETVWSDTGKAIGRILPDGTIQGINEGAANIPNAVQGMVDGAKPPLDSLGPYAEESARSAGERYGGGFETGASGAGDSVDSVVRGLIDSLFGGVPQAQDAGTQTGQGYGDSVSGQGSVAEGAAMQTLGRLLQIWLLGIESARQAGAQTGAAYGEGASAGFANAASAAQAAVQTITNVLNMGIEVARSAGANTGRNYAYDLSQGLLDGAMFADEAVRTITSSLESGVEPARSAGVRTGDGYTNGMKEAASKAPGIARGIATSTGYAFGAGEGAASAAGASLGAAFASAVWSSGGQAISYARSIRNSVKDIFSNIPTANIRVNVTRTVSTSSPSSFGGHPVQYAALPSPTPVLSLDSFAARPLAYDTVERAAVVADSAVRRIASTPSTVAASGMAVATQVVAALGSQSQAPVEIDYGRIEQAMERAVAKMPAPNVSIDGYRLMDYVDRELGRRDRMW